MTNSVQRQVEHVLPGVEEAKDSGTEDVLDMRIEVSPFLELASELGSPIWIRKSAIAAVKGSGRSFGYRSSSEAMTPSCSVFVNNFEMTVLHSAAEVMEALGQGEL